MESLQFIQTTPEALVELINKGIKIQLEDFKKEFSIANSDELMTREQTCAFLKIDSSSLWRWTKSGKVPCHAISNRRYYKKSELLESLIKLKNS